MFVDLGNSEYVRHQLDLLIFKQSLQFHPKGNDTIVEYNRFNHALGKKVATESHRLKDAKCQMSQKQVC